MNTVTEVAAIKCLMIKTKSPQHGRMIQVHSRNIFQLEAELGLKLRPVQSLKDEGGGGGERVRGGGGGV